VLFLFYYSKKKCLTVKYVTNVLVAATPKVRTVAVSVLLILIVVITFARNFMKIGFVVQKLSLWGRQGHYDVYLSFLTDIEKYAKSYLCRYPSCFLMFVT